MEILFRYHRLIFNENGFFRCYGDTCHKTGRIRFKYLRKNVKPTYTSDNRDNFTQILSIQQNGMLMTFNIEKHEDCYNRYTNFQ